MPPTRFTPAQAIAKTLNRVRARGLREVAGLAARRIPAWFSSSDVLVMFVRDTADATEEDKSGYALREASSADADRYARDVGTDSAATFRARLSGSTRCFLIESAEVIIHASWVTSSGAWTRELRAYLVPPQGGVYVYESFTRPETRGHGIYPHALRRIASWAAEAGFTKVWVAVEQDNPASLRAVAKAGFEEAFRLPFARRLGRLQIGTPEGPQAREAATFVSRSRPLPDL